MLNARSGSAGWAGRTGGWKPPFSEHSHTCLQVFVLELQNLIQENRGPVKDLKVFIKLKSSFSPINRMYFLAKNPPPHF